MHAVDIHMQAWLETYEQAERELAVLQDRQRRGESVGPEVEQVGRFLTKLHDIVREEARQRRA